MSRFRDLPERKPRQQITVLHTEIEWTDPEAGKGIVSCAAGGPLPPSVNRVALASYLIDCVTRFIETPTDRLPWYGTLPPFVTSPSAPDRL